MARSIYFDLTPGGTISDLTTVIAANAVVRLPSGTVVSWTLSFVSQTSTALRCRYQPSESELALIGTYQTYVNVNPRTGSPAQTAVAYFDPHASVNADIELGVSLAGGPPQPTKPVVTDTPKIVGTHSDLLNASPASGGVYVQGRSAPGDGGHAFFSYDASQAGTDNSGSIRNGWRANLSGPLDVRLFGAKGDANGSNPTDNTAAFQAAINAALSSGGSGVVLVPPGNYLCGTITIPSSKQGLTIQGGGASTDPTQGTRITKTGTGPLITTSGTTHGLAIQDVWFAQQANASGNIIDPSSASIIQRLSIKRFGFTLSRADSSFLNFVNPNPCRCTVREFEGYMAAGANVPAFNIAPSVIGVTNVFGIAFEHGMMFSNDTATAPIFHVDGGQGSSESISIIFYNVILEQPSGGGIRLSSIRRARVSDVCSADTTPGTQSQPCILIDKTSGGLDPYDVTFLSCTFFGGNDTYPDVRISSPYGPTFVGCRMVYLDAATSTPIIIGGAEVDSAHYSAGTKPLRIYDTGGISGLNGLSSTNVIPRNLCGSVTLSSGHYDVVFPVYPEADASYRLAFTGDANETFYVSNKTVSGFRINSSNGSSTAHVDWMLMR